MGSPAFNPNGSYSAVTFDPKAAYDPAPAATTPTPAAPEGFWHSLGAAFGVTPEDAQARIQNMKDHPVKAALAAAAGPAWELAKGIKDQVVQTGTELGDAAGALSLGDKPNAAIHAIQAVPIVGPALNKAADQYGSGDYAGEAGTLLGASAQAAPLVVGAADAALPTGRPMIPNPRIGRVVGRAALLGKTPEGAYESALKPSTVLSPEERAAAVKTGLDQGIPVSKAGVQKLGDLIDDFNQKIASTIQSDPTRPIDPNAVSTRANAARVKFAKQVNAQPDLNTIEASKQQFLDEQGQKPAVPAQSTGILDAQGNPIMRPAKPATPAPDMNASDAQAMKQGTYRVLAGKYGEQGSASVEAQKALARGLKEEIATQFPEIGAMNAAESKLLDLQPFLERAVNRISNHQAIGIGTPVAGVAAEAMTGSPGIGRVAMVMKGVLDNSSVKSRLAIAVSKGAKISPAQAMSRVNAYVASLGSAALAQQENSNADNPSQPATPQP